MISNIAHLVVLEDGHLIAFVVRGGCTVSTLIEDGLVAGQVSQLFGLPS